MAVGAVVLGDGHAPAEAEGPAGDLEARGGLLALVLAAVDEADDPGHQVGIVSRPWRIINLTYF